MHAKTDSEGTSIDASWPPRSPRRPVYYVQSPSNYDAEKMSYGSSPNASPPNHFYHCSPIHHSRESSTSRFSAALKNPKSFAIWKHIPVNQNDDDDDDMDDEDGHSGRNVRPYFCALLTFVVIFTVFCLILWGASKAYKPEILVKSMVFEDLNVQAGVDLHNMATDMLSLNSTVKIHYRNKGTFFAVHVTSTPFELYTNGRFLASGQMKKFTLSRNSHKTVVTLVQADRVLLYGGVPVFGYLRDHIEKVVVPVNLTFVMRSKGYIMGSLVTTKFYKRVRCPLDLVANKVGKPINLAKSCVYT